MRNRKELNCYENIFMTKQLCFISTISLGSVREHTCRNRNSCLWCKRPRRESVLELRGWSCQLKEGVRDLVIRIEECVWRMEQLLLLVQIYQREYSDCLWPLWRLQWTFESPRNLLLPSYLFLLLSLCSLQVIFLTSQSFFAFERLFVHDRNLDRFPWESSRWWELDVVCGCHSSRWFPSLRWEWWEGDRGGQGCCWKLLPQQRVCAVNECREW